MIRTRSVTLIMIAAWLAIAAIAYATLTKIGFVYSIYFTLAPYLQYTGMQTYGHFIHILAYGLLGALFALAYPKRILLVCIIVLGGASLLEIAQTLTPDRHGTLIDAMEKIAGGIAGILIAKAGMCCWPRQTNSVD